MSTDGTKDHDDVLSRELLVKISRTRMPFGKYSGRYLVDLPEPYVLWFGRQGFPDGELGTMLRIIYEIKINGLEHLLRTIRNSS